MGATYDGIHVRAEKRSELTALLRAISKTAGISVLVSPAVSGWTSVFAENKSEDVAISLADELGVEVLHFRVHDSNVIYYDFFRDRALVDRFDSYPDYFRPVSERQRKALAGDPQVFRPLVSKPEYIGSIKRLLRQHSHADPVESSLARTVHKQLEILAKILHLAYLPWSYPEPSPQITPKISRKAAWSWMSCANARISGTSLSSRMFGIARNQQAPWL